MANDASPTRSSAGGRPLWQWLGLGLLAAVSLAAAGSVVYEVLTQRPVQSPPRPEPLAYQGPSPGSPARGAGAGSDTANANASGDAATQPAGRSTFGALLRGRGPGKGEDAVGRLMTAGRRRPLDRNPAGLPAPEGANRQGRFEQRGPTLAERVGFWQVPGASLDEVADHYDEAAKDRGFTRLGPKPKKETHQDAPATTRPARRLLRFTGPGPGNGRENAALTIQLLESSSGVHVTVWLRYAVGSAGAGAR